MTITDERPAQEQARCGFCRVAPVALGRQDGRCTRCGALHDASQLMMPETHELHPDIPVWKARVLAMVPAEVVLYVRRGVRDPRTGTAIHGGVGAAVARKLAFEYAAARANALDWKLLVMEIGHAIQLDTITVENPQGPEPGP